MRFFRGLFAHLFGDRRASNALRAAGTGLLIAAFLDVVEHGEFKVVMGSSTLLWARGWPHLIAYLFVYAAAVSAMLSILLSRSRLARVSGTAVLGVAILAQAANRLIVGEDISMSSFQLMWADRDVAGGTMLAFRSQMLQAILLALISVVIVAAAVRVTPYRAPLRSLAMVPIGVVAVGAFSFRLVQSTYLPMPAMMRVPVNAAMALSNLPNDGPRTKPDIQPESEAHGARAIVFIMDESIRADALGINGRRPDTTPFLESWPGLINLGTACAPSNVSSTTNYVIRNGLRIEDLPDRERRGMQCPSIFAYAKSAGYRTVMLDGQGVPGRYLNHMNRHDFEFIDEYWSPRQDNADCDPWDFDRAVMERLTATLARRERVFVWVNKYGAHFPYQSCMPPNLLAQDGSMLTPTEALMAGREDAIWATYLAVVQFAVDGFFRELSPQLDLEGTELVYMGDHGQSILEGGYPTTHGVVVDPPRSQVEVPLFLRGQRVSELMARRSTPARNGATGFAVFPSLLELMGYKAADVRSRYGQPLWGSDTKERKYFTGDCFGVGRNFVNPYPAPSKPAPR
jgi:glucan phosphoethanolaminetransferase (alkaline phosphatase superfamily)